MATDTLVCIFLLGLGIAIGFLLKQWLVNRVSSSGTIRVTRDEDRTLYSLELTGYPEEIIFKKQVCFKVDASDESLHRE